MNMLTVKAQIALAQVIRTIKENREAGQGSIEYVGIIIVVAVVLASAIGLLASSGLVSDAVTSGFGKAMEKLMK